MIECTTNYDLFKKHDSNREIDRNNLKRIRNSIRTRNLLSLRPIIVDKNYRVIDGQHRLEVCKNLQIPIYYQVQDDAHGNDIILLNANQRRWILTDYLNFFVTEKKQEYIKINEYLKEKHLNLNICLTLFNQVGGTWFEVFRRGDYKFPDDVKDMERRLHCLTTVQSFLDKKLIGNKKYIWSPTFVKALVGFLNTKEIDFEIFMKKLEYKLDWVRHCTRYVDYYDVFKQIYNFRNSAPLTESKATNLFISKIPK